MEKKHFKAVILIVSLLAVMAALTPPIIVESHYRLDMAAAQALRDAGGVVEFGRDDSGSFPSVNWWPALRHWFEHPTRLWINNIEQQLSITSRFRDATNMILIDVSEGSEDKIADFLLGCQKLHKLQIPYAPIDGRCFASFSHLESIELLSVEGCQVDDRGVGALAALDKIEVLYLSRTKVTDEGINSISALDITDLDIGECAVTGTCAEAISQMPNLISLDVSGTNFDDPAIAILCRNRNLEYLSLSGTLLTDQAIQDLNKLTNCRTLNLRDTKVSNAGAVALGPLPQLEFLNVSKTSISELGQDLEHRFPRLTTLIISKDQFSDEDERSLNERLPELAVEFSSLDFFLP